MPRMFTGIITGLGEIVAICDLGPSLDHGKQLTIQTPVEYLNDVNIGDSIAINGACMTVTQLHPDQQLFDVEISAHSLTLTTDLNHLGPVNLEKALRTTDRLGGHVVSGHVDGIGVVTHLTRAGESSLLRVLAPAALSSYLACKGSIAINGVSLTINEVIDLDSAAGSEISMNLIDHTMQHTTLGLLQSGSQVNIEIDLIARYVVRALAYKS